MDYFVCTHNTPFYHWQLELLLESFKHHNLSENLVISLLPAAQQPMAAFCRSLYAHPRLVSTADIGRIRGFGPLNYLYAISIALEKGTLKQPFMLVQPDSVLFVPPEVSDTKRTKIVVQGDLTFTHEAAKENIPNLQEYFSGKWPAVGNIMYFDNVPLELFGRVMSLTEMLAYEQLKAGKDEIWPYTDRAAWSIILSKMVSGANIEISYTWEMPMVASGVRHNFISYGRGVPAHFVKSMFMFNPISFGDPFEVLAKLPAVYRTEASGYISDLATKCLEKRTVHN